MKVCIIASIFHPYARGGAETAAKNAALAFVKAGDEVVVITAGPYQGWRSLFARVELWQGIKIYRFYPLNIFSFLNISQHHLVWRLVWHVLDTFNLYAYFIVRKILRQEKPELILTHNLKGIGYTIPAAIKCYMLRVTCYMSWFHTLHDMGAIHPTGLLIYGQENSFLQKFFLARLYARVNAWLFGSPDVIISPSKFLLDFYLKQGFFKKSKTAVIHNPIFSNPPSVPPLSKGETGGFLHTCFLYLGQLEPYKGINLLISAWQEFRKQKLLLHPLPSAKGGCASGAEGEGWGEGCELHIIGSGSMSEVVEKQAMLDKSIKYHGPMSNEKVGEMLRQSNFLIVPSLVYENSPMAIVESFSYGVPVIASRLGGMPELIQEGENGFLFEPGSQEDLLKVLNKAVLADWPALSTRAQEGAKSFSEEFYVKQIKEML